MRRNLHGNRYHAVAADGAVDWDHPLNRGRALWLYTPPGVAAAGSRWLNLCDPRTGGTLTNMVPGATSGWAPTTRPGGLAEVRFDGVDDLVILTDAPALHPAAALTYAAWVRTDSLTVAQQAIRGVDSALGATYGFTLSLNAVTLGKYLFALKTAGDNLLEATTPDTGWHRVVATYDGATQRLYVDGALVATQAATGAVSYGTGAMLLGRVSSTTGALPFAGRLDDVSVWNRALPAAEVQADYDLSRNGYRVPDSPLRWLSTRTYFVPRGGLLLKRRRVLA